MHVPALALRLAVAGAFVALPAAAQPGDGGAAYAAGHQALASGDTTAALTWFQEAARLLPDEAAPPYNVAVLLSARGDRAASARWFEGALANLERPQTLTAETGGMRAAALAGLVRSGAGLFTAGQVADAERLFSVVIRHDPSNRDAWYNRSLALYKLERWADLVPAATRLVELDPLSYNAWILLFNGHKGVSDAAGIAGNAEQQAAARDRALQTLAHADQLPVQVSEVAFRSVSGTVEVTGIVTGGSRPAGSAVRIEIELVDAGRVVALTAVSLAAPAKDASVRFTASASAAEVTSYRYRLLQ